MDPKIFTAVVAFVTALVGAVKKAFPVWTAGKEPLLAMVAAVATVVGLKALGAIEGTPWMDAGFWAFWGGLGAGVVHDKAVNPLLAGKAAPVERPV